MRKNIIGILIFTQLVYACSPFSKSALTNQLRDTENKFQDHTGFVLYDLQKKKTVYEYNGARYFTPGSNTKIFTLFASLKIIGDSIPALKYTIHDDSLIFQGTGDASFLNRNVFNNNRVYDFLKNAKQDLYFTAENFQTTHLGKGWAWDDYNDAYSAERFSFPIYGNAFSVYNQNSSLSVEPLFFKKYVAVVDTILNAKVIREVDSNQTKYYPAKITRNSKWTVPFKVDPLFITTLLQDTLKRLVYLKHATLSLNTSTLYSIPADSLYKVLMQESDNFIAEHLLLTCAGILSDTLKTEIAIKYVKDSLLSDLVDEPIWIDGSGLSRYNLFTPRSIIQLWEKIYVIVPRDRLFSLLATGGKKGTLRDWYKAEVPYVFGKTGTLSNNHCLSGFLVSKSGKTFIFSFMNNNFTSSTNDIRQNMQDIINRLYDRL